MKRYVIALIMVLSIFLVSCGSSSGDDLAKDRFDDAICNEALASELNLSSLTNNVINEIEENNGNYYNVLVADDVKSSMVIHNYDLDSDFKKSGSKVDSVNFQTLAFRKDIYNSEKEKLPAILFSEDNKLNKENVEGLDLGFEMSRNVYWKKSFESCEIQVGDDKVYTSIKTAYDAYKNGEDNIKFSVVYLPVSIERFNAYDRCLDAYVLVPVYWYLTVYEDGVYKDIIKSDNGYALRDSVLNNYRTVQLQFEKDGRLLNKTVEA